MDEKLQSGSGEDRRPPMRPSDEAEPQALELARRQGERYGEALRHMLEEVADAGGQQRAGDFLIAWAVEKAEGMYRPGDRVEVEFHPVHIETGRD